RAVPVAITGQSSWPSAGHSLATYGQLFMAAYTQRSPLPKGAETALYQGDPVPFPWRPQRSPLPKGAETAAEVADQGSVRDASTKSAPQRSGDTPDRVGGGRAMLASTKSAPQRSGDVRRWGRCEPGSRCLNEVRSPKERRPCLESVSPEPDRRLNEVRSPKERRRRRELDGGPHRPASTKSAPQRSGDGGNSSGPAARVTRLNEVRSPKEWRQRDQEVSDVTSHGPQRSPLHKGAETRRHRRRGHPLPASTKSAPQRSGDRWRVGPGPGLTRLNEVRSTKERRLPAGAGHHGPREASTKSAPQRSGDCSSLPLHGLSLLGLNEVRSTKERRPQGRGPQPRRPPASTKPAPQRSGDIGTDPETRAVVGMPQRSPLPKGAETHLSPGAGVHASLASTKSAPQRSGDSTSDYSPLTWADATFGEPWAQEASVKRPAYRPRPINRGLTSPFLMRRLAGFRTSTEPSRRSLGRFR
ncbi:hypothetical protein ACUXOP_002114, partial [Micrococcus aloeverae]